MRYLPLRKSILFAAILGCHSDTTVLNQRLFTQLRHDLQPGDIVWSRSYGEGDFQEVSRAIRNTADKGYIVAGIRYAYDKNGNTNLNSFDGYALKVDHLGNVQWSAAYDVPGMQNYLNDIQPVPEGGYIATGIIHSDAEGGVAGSSVTTQDYRDGWLLRLSDEGEIKWSRRFRGSDFGLSDPAAPHEDYFRRVKNVKDGFLVVGHFNHKLFDPTESAHTDILITRTDLEGNTLWSNTYDLAENLAETATDLFVTFDENGNERIVLTGYAVPKTQVQHLDAMGNNSGLILVLDGEGKVQWLRSVSELPNGNAYMRSVRLYAADNMKFQPINPLIGSEIYMLGGLVAYPPPGANGPFGSEWKCIVLAFRGNSDVYWQREYDIPGDLPQNTTSEACYSLSVAGGGPKVHCACRNQTARGFGDSQSSRPVVVEIRFVGKHNLAEDIWFLHYRPVGFSQLFPKSFGI